MKNCTYQLDSWVGNADVRVCDNGKNVSLDSAPYTVELHQLFLVEGHSGALDLPLRVQKPFTQFQFVSCGALAEPSVPFETLVASYDTVVWLFLLWTLAGLLGVDKLVIRSGLPAGGHGQHLLPLIKTLLEQGSPFSAHRLKET